MKLLKFPINFIIKNLLIQIKKFIEIPKNPNSNYISTNIQQSIDLKFTIKIEKTKNLKKLVKNF